MTATKNASRSAASSQNLLELSQLLLEFLENPRKITKTEAEWIAETIQHQPGYDLAWKFMHKSNAHIHIDLWSQIAKHHHQTDPDGNKTVWALSLTALAAWLAGCEILAHTCIEWVKQYPTKCRLAEIIAQILNQKIPPQKSQQLKTRTHKNIDFIPTRIRK